MSGWDEDENAVGFGRPPKHTRYKPGQSGNPKGRPRKKRSPEPSADLTGSERALRKVLDEKVAITEAGGKRKATKSELIDLAQIKAAVGGNPQAQRDIKRREQELEKREAEAAERERKWREERYDFAVDWQDKMRTLWKRAEAQNEEPKVVWPHPDDFLFVAGTLDWRIRGPMNEEEVPIFEYYRAQRDLAFFKMVQALAAKDPNTVEASVMRGCTVFYDATLPKRWQMTEEDWIDKATPLLALSADKFDILIENVEQRVTTLSRPDNLPRPDRSTNRIVSKMLKPLFQRAGYRSLAHFESQHEGEFGRA